MKDIINQLINAFSITALLDIIIMTLIIYKVLGFIRESRAEQLVKGILLIVAVAVLSDWFNFYTINWIFEEATTIGILALIILFQPELRRGLEQVGRANLVSSSIKNLTEGEEKILIEEIATAVDGFSKTKTGALIVIEGVTALDDIAETGTSLNSKITTELLGNLFYSGSPLHDGVVIIRGNMILAAGCVLPLTQNTDLPKEMGTRHRAGIGITENSDAKAIIVSEETGVISIAEEGEITRNLRKKDIEDNLEKIFKVEKNTIFDKLKNKRKRAGGKYNVQK